jgi:hypothetical protein
MYPEYGMDDEAGKSDRSERKELSQLYNISKLYLSACNLPDALQLLDGILQFVKHIIRIIPCL